MGNNNGASSGNQPVEKGQRVTRIAVPAGAGEEQRGQRVLGGSKAAPAPESVPPLTSMPPVVLETQQMSPAPTAPVSQGPAVPATQAPAAPANE
jgi:hypothetical protein